MSPQNLLNSLASGLATPSSVAGEGISALSNTTASPLLAALSSIGNETGTGTTKPQAYLNWMLLDNQFNYASGGAIQVGAAGQNGGNLQSPLAQMGIAMSKSGYLYIYVSNATPGWDVFFDNLSVKQYSGPMIEENHYYPGGLSMAGICDMAIKSSYAKNKYLFQRQELQNKEFSDGSGLETMDFIFRMYDHQLGRFLEQDPLSTVLTSLSPYQFEANNPILFIDPLGLDTVRVNGSGSHRIRIGQGDVLAWTTEGQTSYYTYDPSNKDAVNGFVGNGIESSELPAAGVTATSKNSEKSSGELWMAGLSFAVGKADFANSMMERAKLNLPSAVGSNGHYPIIGQRWWSKVKGNEKFAEGEGYGLALLNSALTFRELNEQYKKGGISGVSPVTAIDFGLGATGLGATSLKFLNVAPATMGSISGFAAIGGAGIQSYYQWSEFYMMLNNTSNLPNNPAYSGTSNQQFQAALDDDGGGWGNPH